MPLYMKMSENISETTRHLKFRYISIDSYKSSTDCFCKKLHLRSLAGFQTHVIK